MTIEDPEKPAREGEPVTDDDAAGIPWPRLQVPLDNEDVSLADVVLANAMRSPFIEADERKRVVGRHYYPLLRAMFLKNHRNAQVAFQDGAGLAVCLYQGAEGVLDILVIQSTIRFEWTDARLVQAELNELDEDIARLLPTEEQRGIRLSLFGLLSQVHAAIARENRRHQLGVQDVPPTANLATELAAVRPSIANVRLRLEEEGQRAAQIVYTRGMGEGAMLLGLLCLGLAGIFIWQHIPAVNGIGALAGGIGACLSVFERLTRKRLRLDYRSEGHFLRLFGGVRPFIGAAFGTITYCVIRAELLPKTIEVPHSQNALLAFVAFFAFFAAFNERFFQDMLRTASTGLGGSVTDTDEPLTKAMPDPQK